MNDAIRETEIVIGVTATNTTLIALAGAVLPFFAFNINFFIKYFLLDRRQVERCRARSTTISAFATAAKRAHLTTGRFHLASRRLPCRHHLYKIPNLLFFFVINFALQVVVDDPRVCRRF